MYWILQYQKSLFYNATHLGFQKHWNILSSLFVLLAFTSYVTGANAPIDTVNICRYTRKELCALTGYSIAITSPGFPDQMLGTSRATRCSCLITTSDRISLPFALRAEFKDSSEEDMKQVPKNGLGCRNSFSFGTNRVSWNNSCADGRAATTKSFLMQQLGERKLAITDHDNNTWDPEMDFPSIEYFSENAAFVEYRRWGRRGRRNGGGGQGGRFNMTVWFKIPINASSVQVRIRCERNSQLFGVPEGEGSDGFYPTGTLCSAGSTILLNVILIGLLMLLTSLMIGRSQRVCHL